MTTTPQPSAYGQTDSAEQLHARTSRELDKARARIRLAKRWETDSSILFTRVRNLLEHGDPARALTLLRQRDTDIANRKDRRNAR